MSLHKLQIPKIPYEEARDSVILWKKGRKKKPDPTHFVYSAWNMVHRYHEGSFKEAARDVKGITPRMMRKLASVAEVVASSETIGRLLEEGKISLEVTSELAGIKDLELRSKVAETIAGMKALDQRQVVRFAKRYPHAPFEQFEKFRQRVLSSKNVTERIYMAILPLTEEEYKKLKEESKKLEMSWDELCMKIIKDWLNERRHD